MFHNIIKNIFTYFFIITLSSCTSTEPSNPHSVVEIPPQTSLSTTLNPHDVSIVLNLVTDWQIKYWELNRKKLTNHKAHWNERGWVFGTLYPGMNAWANLSNNTQYKNHLHMVFERNNWQLGKRTYNADDYVTGYSYLNRYEQTGSKQKAMITPLIKRLDKIIEKPAKNSLWFPNRMQRKRGAEHCTNRWCWCDAVFMGPPTFYYLSEVTGNMKYANFANKEFWKSTAYLYDKDEQLFYRDSRFFEKRDNEGNKIFWSRGNGWVLAGIARMLDHMPKDYPTRASYELLFKTMAKKLATLAREDGYWPTSLLNPNNPTSKETSGTGFYVYGFAWGINNGLLDAHTYQPFVKKGWEALVKSVYKDGRLGWVQIIGYEPHPTAATSTQLYGAGALLLAGTEIIKMHRSSINDHNNL